MSKEERIAIQNVVGGRQPKLIHLAPEETDEEADEPEVVEEEEGEGEKLVSIKLLEPETTLDESPSRPTTTKTPPREKKCANCGFTCRLQIQMNRHKNLCVKTESKSSLGSKWKLKVKERRKSDEGTNINQRKSLQVSGKKPKKSPYVSPGKGVPCPECNKEFRNQAVLDRHFEDLHQPGEFPCPGGREIVWESFHLSQQDEQPLFKELQPKQSCGSPSHCKKKSFAWIMIHSHHEMFQNYLTSNFYVKSLGSVEIAFCHFGSCILPLSVQPTS